MSRRKILVPLLALGCLIHFQSYAQDPEPDDDLGDVTDAFQENFFEALKQKAILNYEKALESLANAGRAAKGNPEQEAVVFFEMGKNYFELKKYSVAEEWFNKALELAQNRKEIIVSLYDVYYQTREYDKAIEVVKKLIVFDQDYKEDLANLYVRTQQYDNAIAILDELDNALGGSAYRDNLRKQIFRQTGDSTGEVARLEGLIAKNPKDEKQYLNLIFVHSEAGDSQKAFETAQELLRQVPDSELVHLALYKFYLEDAAAQQAIESMKIVFSSDEIDADSKTKVLADFMRFSNDNPSYEETFIEMVSSFATEGGSADVYKQLGDYFVGKGQKEKALTFYAMGSKQSPSDFELLKNTLLLQLDLNKFDEAIILSQEGLDIYPSQALLYLLRGVAFNGLTQSQDAIDVLEEGIDYVIDDRQMEKDFYEQLSKAYQATNNSQKAAEFAKKARDLGMQ
ncbi:MAG: hypothetical protein ABJM06_10610 [Gilvibacter sp.]